MLDTMPRQFADVDQPVSSAQINKCTEVAQAAYHAATNFAFLQLVFGYLIGRVVISFLLLPHYFRGELYTAYQLIERRFDTPAPHSGSQRLPEVVEHAAVVRALPELEQLGVRLGCLPEPDSVAGCARHVQMGKLLPSDN